MKPLKPCSKNKRRICWLWHINGHDVNGRVWQKHSCCNLSSNGPAIVIPKSCPAMKEDRHCGHCPVHIKHQDCTVLVQKVVDRNKQITKLEQEISTLRKSK